MSLEDNSKELTLLTSAFARDDAEPTSANDQETGTMGRTLMSGRYRRGK